MNWEGLHRFADKGGVYVCWNRVEDYLVELGFPHKLGRESGFINNSYTNLDMFRCRKLQRPKGLTRPVKSTGLLIFAVHQAALVDKGCFDQIPILGIRYLQHLKLFVFLIDMVYHGLAGIAVPPSAGFQRGSPK